MSVEKNQREWDVHYYEFRSAYNTAVHPATRVSSAFLNFGREPQPVLGLRREVESEQVIENQSTDIWVERKKPLRHLLDILHIHHEIAQEKERAAYNKTRRFAEFNIDDEVWLWTHELSNAAKGINAKLCAKFRLPSV